MSLTKRQIATRSRGIGGSEMLAALGKDSRCSRLELYMRKVGELPEPDFADDQRVHFGRVLEPVVRDEFARRKNLRVVGRRHTYVHPKLPIVASPDGQIPSLGTVGLECKVADRFEAEEFGEPESDQVPVRYVVQCSTYMLVRNAPSWYLAVLIGGNDYRIYEIHRDPALEAAIVAGAREFWSHVEQRRPPDPQTPDDVKLRWPKSLGETVVATPEIEEACAELARAKKTLKEAELHEASTKMLIQQFMAEASELVDSTGKKLATWRTNKSSTRYDTKKLVEEYPALMAEYEFQQPGARPFLLK